MIEGQGHGLGTFMLKVYVKVFRTSLFPNPLMDLVHVWSDDRYWSKILHSAIPTPIHDFKVKVTDLDLLSSSFALKFQDVIVSKPYDGFGSCLL